MPEVHPPRQQLSEQLRQLRQQKPRFTQKMLAEAFSVEEPVSGATVSSWESPTSPKLPPPHRLEAYARFFCTPRSIDGPPKLLQRAELTPDELQAYEKLKTELERLSQATSDATVRTEQISNRSWHFPDGARVTFECLLDQ